MFRYGEVNIERRTELTYEEKYWQIFTFIDKLETCSFEICAQYQFRMDLDIIMHWIQPENFRHFVGRLNEFLMSKYVQDVELDEGITVAW